MGMSMKITAVFMLFMIYAFNCGRLQGSYNLDVVADGILANLTEFKQNAIAQFQRKNLTLDEQDSIYERLGDKVEELHKEMKNFHNKFEMVVEKMSNQTRVNELIHKKNYLEHLFREIKKMGEEKEKEMRSKERETRPHGKRNGTEDEDENLDVVADRILANLNQFKQYAIVQFQSKNLTESAFERIGARFEGISREMKNYRYKFEQAAEKMNNKTRVRELYEKKQLMKKISREINNMGEEREAELPRYKNRRETRHHGKENQEETRPHGKENQGKRNGSENKNSPRNSTRNPNGKGPHAKRNGSENKNSTRNSTRNPNRKGPHAKRNGTENKNSTRNSTRRPNRKGPHGIEDEDDDDSETRGPKRGGKSQGRGPKRGGKSQMRRH